VQAAQGPQRAALVIESPYGFGHPKGALQRGLGPAQAVALHVKHAELEEGIGLETDVIPVLIGLLYLLNQVVRPPEAVQIAETFGQ